MQYFVTFLRLTLIILFIVRYDLPLTNLISSDLVQTWGWGRASIFWGEGAYLDSLHPIQLKMLDRTEPSLISIGRPCY